MDLYMLIDTFPQVQEKRLCLFIRNEAFQRVLVALLNEWRYSLQEVPTASDLVLAEDGFDLPEECGPVLWLTRSRYGERGRLPLPLSIEELWSALESRFHKPPRNHIRINLQFSASVVARGERADVQITSLSDLGVRFEFLRELAPGEEIVVYMSPAGHPLALPGRVIYVVPRGDLDESEKMQVGVIFDHLSKEAKDILRLFIIRAYLEKVRSGMTGTVFREGISHFNVPPEALAELSFS